MYTRRGRRDCSSDILDVAWLQGQYRRKYRINDLFLRSVQKLAPASRSALTSATGRAELNRIHQHPASMNRAQEKIFIRFSIDGPHCCSRVAVRASDKRLRDQSYFPSGIPG